jgi:hypothetical protein
MQFTPARSAAPSQAASTNMGHAKELKQQHVDLKIVIFDIYRPLGQLAEYSAARRIRLQMGNSSLSSFVAVRLVATTSSPRRTSLQHCGMARRKRLLCAEYNSLYATVDNILGSNAVRVADNTANTSLPFPATQEPCIWRNSGQRTWL